MRSTPAEERDGLQQARLAGRIRPVDELRAGTEGRLERGVPTKIERADRVEQAIRAVSYEVVRTGMTTWTYWSSPMGLKTPGDSGPLSSRANCSAATLVSTSAR